MTKENRTLSIIVPAYNSEKTLAALLAELKSELSKHSWPYEVIFVNDGSRDGTWPTIEQLCSENPGLVRGINLMRNYGQHNALLCGIRAARNNTCITMDDDLQHPASAIPVLLACLDEGAEVVYGAPLQENHGLFRDLASILTKMALKNIINAESARNISAFRAFPTRLRNAFADFREATVSLDVLLSWATAKFSSVKVNHRPRKEGQSNYTFRKLVSHAMNMITGYSTLPLRISSAVGFVFTAFGIVVFLYAFIRYLIYGGVVPGFTFLASMVAIFSGATLFALGMMGEYLARMHYRLMDKPPYTIGETKGFDD